MSAKEPESMIDHGVTFGRTAPTLRVSDMDRAVEFYCGVLGMKKTFENGSPVGFVILARDKAEIHLSLAPGHKGSTANVLHLIVEDATTLHDHLDANGTRIIKGLRDQEYGLRDFIFADPDGNRIDVGQPTA
ncbi:MAG: VOC family protein [Gemmatimonadetes bacterium]|jgi:catechol 2,3-dioxygenase-like lactoylglutathione lyase family enzyme|nr:VOC family protein [Gemmatimonadota bacterium]